MRPSNGFCVSAVAFFVPLEAWLTVACEVQGPTQPLFPPHATPLPLWLALLLKKQRRANISPPAWLRVDELTHILDFETDERTAEIFSPSPKLPRPTTTAPLEEDPYLAHDALELSSPFLKNSATAQAQDDALPYHWLELSHLLLTHAADDFDDPDGIRRLLRDLREVRMSKLRKGFKVLDAGAGVKMNGVGGMEIAEVRGFVGGVVDGLRLVLDASRQCPVSFIGQLLTTRTGRLTALEKKLAKRKKRSNVRMDWEVVAIVMTRTTTCCNEVVASFTLAVTKLRCFCCVS